MISNKNKYKITKNTQTTSANPIALPKINEAQTNLKITQPRALNSLLFLRDNLGNEFEKTFNHNILSRLFGRRTRTTKITHLNDLISLSMCSKDAKHTVSCYIRLLANSYNNDFKFFNHKCLNIDNEKDGLKILMIKGLPDTRSYLIILSNMFKSRFNKHLNNIDFNNTFTPLTRLPSIDNTIKTLNVILKTNQFNNQLNSIILNLDTILSNNESSWNRKKLAFDILIKLSIYQCIDCNHPTFIKSLNQAIALLDLKEWTIVNHVILNMQLLGQAGLLNGMAGTILMELYTKTANLINRTQSELAYNALATIVELHKINLLNYINEDITFNILASILIHASRLLNSETPSMIISKITLFIRTINLTKLSYHKLQYIFAQAEQLLDHQEDCLNKIALTTIIRFHRTTFLKLVDPQIRKTIFRKVEQQLDQKRLNPATATMLIIAQYAKANLLEVKSKMIDRIFLNAIEYLNHKQLQVVESAIVLIAEFVEAKLLTIETVSPYLHKIEPELIKNLYNKAKQELTDTNEDVTTTALALGNLFTQSSTYQDTNIILNQL